MYLVDHEIRTMRQRGAVVIEPFAETQLMPQSYDLQLGRYFWPYNARRRLYKTDNYASVPEWVEALDALQRTSPHSGFASAPVEWEFALMPQSGVLAHTEEFFGGTVEPSAGNVCCNAYISTTSTAARHGLSAHPSAGHGDPGYINRWTLEIFNFGMIPIVLTAGMVIAQALFARCSVPEHLYSKRSGSGHYQTDCTLAELFARWQPQDMLPKKLKVMP